MIVTWSVVYLFWLLILYGMVGEAILLALLLIYQKDNE